jgi:hypothetical protein
VKTVRAIQAEAVVVVAAVAVVAAGSIRRA